MLVPTAFAQTAMQGGGVSRMPEPMSIEDRRIAISRCDSTPAGFQRERCMEDLVLNRNEVRRNQADAARSDRNAATRTLPQPMRDATRPADPGPPVQPARP